MIDETPLVESIKDNIRSNYLIGLFSKYWNSIIQSKGYKRDKYLLYVRFTSDLIETCRQELNKSRLPDRMDLICEKLEVEVRKDEDKYKKIQSEIESNKDVKGEWQGYVMESLILAIIIKELKEKHHIKVLIQPDEKVLFYDEDHNAFIPTDNTEKTIQADKL